jgi:hypothetical protein
MSEIIAMAGIWEAAQSGAAAHGGEGGDAGAGGRAAGELRAGEALCIVSSFRPQPLIEALEGAGYAVECRPARPGRFETCIVRV